MLLIERLSVEDAVMVCVSVVLQVACDMGDSDALTETVGTHSKFEIE